MPIGVYILTGIVILGILAFGGYVIKKITETDVHRISTDDFAGCLAILNTIIQVEFDIYNQDIFTKKETITNTNFENFYNDLTHKIINSIPEEFINRMTSYYTVDAIYTYIARRCKIFLTEKIHGTM